MLRPPENPKNIYHFTFLRHGESIGNARGLYQGQADFHLSEKGFEQARLLGEYWKKTGKTFDRIISSPLLRARQTAQTIAGLLNLQIRFDNNLMERNSGKIAGMTPDEANRRYPQPSFTHLYHHFGITGESEWELFLRAGHAVQSLLEQPPSSYLVVSHGGILNKVMLCVLGIFPQPNFYGPHFRFENTAFASLTYTPSEHVWRVLSLNERPHLPPGDSAEEGIAAGMEPVGAYPGGRKDPAEFSIRPALKEDIDSLVPVFEEADRFHQVALPHIFRPQSPQQTRQFIASIFEKEDNHILLAETGEKVIGMVYFYPRGSLEIPILVPRKWVVVDSLAVLPEARRCGVGTALMERVHRWAVENGISEVELNVYEFNAGAIKLYESLGYSTLRLQMRITLK